MSNFKYTKEKPLRVFTSFSGYDSQCMALDRIGIPYELVGWSEIDKYAIQAHNALYPQWADRNAGDISKIDWGGNRILTFLHIVFLALTSPMQDSRKDLKKARERDPLSFGNAARLLRLKDQSICLWRMSKL